MLTLTGGFIFQLPSNEKNQRQESVLEIKRIRAAKAFLICVPERLMYIHGIFMLVPLCPCSIHLALAMPIFFRYILQNSSQAIKKLIASADNKQNMTLSNARRSHTEKKA